MSRSLTAAQVIGLGEYLNPNFDPSSLTVSQLLGVLGFHNIQYPTPYTKPKLVQLFSDQITAKSAKLRRERQKKEQSLASDDGITDGLTGKPIGKDRKPPARRSSRRSSRTDFEHEIVSDQPPKRRRSSAQPNLGGTSRKNTTSQPALMEESEPEEDVDAVIRKVGRSKKGSETAGAQARRISVAEDSGWEDNNIFQSGAESSSPVRPSASKPKAPRKSASTTATRKSRKSMSAPPQSSPSSSPPKAPQFAEQIKQTHGSPTFKFEPTLPSGFSREARVAAANKAKRNGIASSVDSSPTVAHLKDEGSGDDELNVIGVDTSANNIQHVANDTLDDVEEDEDQTIAVSRRIAQGGQLVPAKPQTNSMPWTLRILYLLVAAACSAAVVNYKKESAPIGYCDTGKDTNTALEALKIKWDAIETCNRENRTFLQLPPIGSSDSPGDHSDPILCPPPALIPFIHTTHCTPCPEHAACVKNTVKCDNGFLMKPHPLFSILPPFDSSISAPVANARKLIEDVTNGLPWFGPVAFPVRCVDDPQRKKHIGALGKAVEAFLGQERGLRVCAGEGLEVFENRDGGEAKNWGMDMGELREIMKKKTPPQLQSTFDDTFDEAIQQLVQWGGVILGEDSSGKRYLAHGTPNLTWNCAVTVKSREIWAEWRATVLMIATLIGSSFVLKAQRASRAVENKRVGELVQIALDTLRNQELAHHTDPITAPQPYLSSLQLRDLILQDEHSVSSRRRLWDQVERVVEGNANVRANLEEVHGGDELRVWRWIGGAGRSPGMRKRVQFEDRGE